MQKHGQGEALLSHTEGAWLWGDVGRAGICFGLAGGWQKGVWKEEARQNPRFFVFRNLIEARGVREVRSGMGESCRPFGPR